MPTAEHKAQVAHELAQKHYQIEAGITQIIRLTDRSEVELQPRNPIKLLDINTNTVPSGIMPIGFGPRPNGGITYPSVIIEVTPDEFRKIQSRELALPEGWTLGEEIPREVEAE